MNRFGLSADLAIAERLDQALTRAPFSSSRRGAKRLLDSGRVVLNGRIIGVASRMTASGDHLTVIAEEAVVPILHQSEGLLVIDKPPGIPTQPSPGSDAASLLEVVTSMLRRNGEPAEVELIHRLDTNTSGVILFARTKAAAKTFAERISGEAEKSYLAIVEGTIAEAGVVDAPIARASGNLFAVSAAGKRAVTTFEPLAAGTGATLVRANLETGRTHQIRVHFASVGHPVVGDRKYGSEVTGNATARSMLHAWRIRIGSSVWMAPPPPDFIEALRRFGIEDAVIRSTVP